MAGWLSKALFGEPPPPPVPLPLAAANAALNLPPLSNADFLRLLDETRTLVAKHVLDGIFRVVEGVSGGSLGVNDADRALVQRLLLAHKERYAAQLAEDPLRFVKTLPGHLVKDSRYFGSSGTGDCRMCGGAKRLRYLDDHKFETAVFIQALPCFDCSGAYEVGPGRLDAVLGEPGTMHKIKIGGAGYLYILHLQDGLLKIGHTARLPKTRAGEWKLDLLAFANSDDSAASEKRVHQHLAEFRKGAYEIFDVPFAQAVSALEKYAGAVTVVRTPD